ncbi:MAG: hypothetical protein KAW66_14310 [Candidatus Lokiarchaeota archaeon]|jgi:hypothetical protein|nr:hypothetical protein [Candidatus Lokiarchaeota archaeon]
MFNVKEAKVRVKLVFKTFLCPECGLVRHLKVGNMCVDCKDKLFLDKISQSRKEQHIFNELICA